MAELVREDGAMEEELARQPPAGRFDRPAAGVEEHVAELRAVRDRLAHELAVLERRVDELATVPPSPSPRPERARSERGAELALKLHQTRAELEASRWMRTAIADHLVAREHEHLASVGIEDERRGDAGRFRWRRRLALLLAGLLAGGVLGGVVGASVIGGDDPPAPAAKQRPAAPAPPAAAPAVLPCTKLPADAGNDGTITCTTGTTLGITSGRVPLLLDGIEVRVLRSVRSDLNVDVRVRVRNATDSEQDLAGRLYLALEGQRLPPITPPGVVGPRAVRTLSLSFPTAGTTARRADLGVVPFDEPADPARARRLGAIRLAF